MHASHIDIEAPQFKGKPHGWIQWKGTEVCIDLRCICGINSHYDGDFLYFWECPHCHVLWEMGTHIQMYPVSTEDRDDVRRNGCVQEVK